MNDMSENVPYPNYSNNLDEDDEIYGTNSPNTGMTETEKEELKMVMVHGNSNQILVSEPMDTSEEGFEMVERENNDDPHLTGCNACESFKRKWDDEKAKLQMLLQAEEKKVMDIGDTLRMRTEEKEKNEAELLKYKPEQENWEKERAELLRSLEDEKQNVKTVEILWANEIKEKKEKAEKELLKYMLEKENWEKERAELLRSLEDEKQKVETVEILWANEIKEIKEKAEKELLKYNAEKENWEKVTVELLRSLEEEKQKVQTVEIFWANEIKEIDEKAEIELLKYNAEKENWEKETAELHRSLEEEKQKVKKVEIFWANKIREIKENAEKEIDQLKNKYIYCNGLIQQHTNEKEILLQTVENLKLEKDNLQTRLSSIASDRMTHENVNITDLSDADRPTKLQEVYSELYDNGWTDAFEELTEQQKIPEKDVVMILLDILMISFQKCREITWGRYEKLRCVASSVEILQRKPISVADKNVATENVDSGDPNVSAAWKDKFEDENEKGFQCTIDLCIDLEKKIKDIWRTTTLELKENVIEQLYSVIETCQNRPLNDCPITSKYLKSCINLCWKMGVQERPMHLDTVSELDDFGKKFDTNKFRAYTRSGKNVAFVVWPALFLNEGGPMLAKGIAQGCSNDEEQNTGMHF